MKFSIVFLSAILLLSISCSKEEKKDKTRTKGYLRKKAIKLALQQGNKKNKEITPTEASKVKDSSSTNIPSINRSMTSNKAESKTKSGSNKFGGVGLGGGGGLGGKFGKMTSGRRRMRPRRSRRPGYHPGKRPVPRRPVGKPLSDFDKKRNNKNFNTESYDRLYENPFERVTQAPLSTFSIDVDTAAYSNMRRFLKRNKLPPKDSVRIEEMLNYFSYEYKSPDANSTTPFAVNAELTSCPWNKDRKLLRIGIKGKAFSKKKLPRSNLVFLLDVSGSMFSSTKLPLLQKALRLLVNKLTPKDKVAIVVYAGASGVVLNSTSAENKAKILLAIDNLRAGGSTNGGAGIEMAYKIAMKNFVPKGINRVILATDGDFNVGVSSRGELVRMVEQRAKKNVFLTVLGFGMGNYKDATLEKLANKGNGNYAYIDTIKEARKVLVKQMGGTLVTIAKDVKIQIEFNPAKVKGYRLIGYENRMLAAKDFNNDKKDAGEIGAGHMVTAIYELVPPGKSMKTPGVDPLKYQTVKKLKATAAGGNELSTIKIRYKKPHGKKSILIKFPIQNLSTNFKKASRDMRFASAVASFGMILRGSKYKGSGTMEKVLDMAQAAKGKDKDGYREEFISLVKIAKSLKK
jgi:Ca-activated chloride channel homolog